MTKFVDPGQVDPKLKRAKDEIKAVAEKYDLCVAVGLTSKTHGEFFHHFAPLEHRPTRERRDAGQIQGPRP